jgi:hypothetical protein
MNEMTKDSYRKLAKNFYKERLNGEVLSPERICAALIACAEEYRPAYWRRLRSAIAFDQNEKNYAETSKRISELKNPQTTLAGGSVKSKQSRVRQVTEVEVMKLQEELDRLDDLPTLAAVWMVKLTGVRPAEIHTVRIIDGVVVIRGAKKSHSGQRGADRALVLIPDALKVVASAIAELHEHEIGPIQDRLRAAAKRVWPQRRALPTLCSFRHQMGSNLKASGMSRCSVAYVMGHQSTASVDQYGNRKTAGPGAIFPRVPDDADLAHIREKHCSPPNGSEPEYDFGFDFLPKKRRSGN